MENKYGNNIELFSFFTRLVHKKLIFVKSSTEILNERCILGGRLFCICMEKCKTLFLALAFGLHLGNEGVNGCLRYLP